MQQSLTTTQTDVLREDNVIRVFDQSGSLITDLLAQLRDNMVQKDRGRFRDNLQKLGFLESFEISRDLADAGKYDEVTVQSPLAPAPALKLAEQPVLGTILSAGVPMWWGGLQAFPHADSAFYSAYRIEGTYDQRTGGMEVVLEYARSPSLEGKTLILYETMLATASSLIGVYFAACDQFGTPSRTIVASAIAARSGVAAVRDKIPNARLYVGAIDEKLNDHAFIVPGLGDAGDLCFGVPIRKPKRIVEELH